MKLILTGDIYFSIGFPVGQLLKNITDNLSSSFLNLSSKLENIIFFQLQIKFFVFVTI